MVCLVLSAGGMFGAYQAGAWSVLAEAFRPDAVVGASAGALNGWAIAGNVAPGDLIARWTDPRMAEVMRPHAGWKGLFDPGPLECIVREMFAQSAPVIPYGAVVVEVPSLRLRLVRGEEIEWRHLLASCAVPFGYPPVRLDGKLHVDGGFLGALPLWAAPLMGADRALAIDVLSQMPSRTLRFVVGTARRLSHPPPGPEPRDVIRLVPSRTLGTVRDAVHWTAANARAWIELGAHDAQRLIAGLPDSVSRNVFR